MCIIVLTHRCPLELIKNYLNHLKICLNNFIHDPPTQLSHSLLFPIQTILQNLA